MKTRKEWLEEPMGHRRMSSTLWICLVVKGKRENAVFLKPLNGQVGNPSIHLSIIYVLFILFFKLLEE